MRHCLEEPPTTILAYANMELFTSSQAPPPYTPETKPVGTTTLVDRISSVVISERGTDNASDVETDRLRNFMTYTLAVDYNRNTKASLSATDREHYMSMYGLLGDLSRAHDQTDLTANERTTAAPYFWRYLHEPSTTLGIPVECAVAAIIRFCKYQNFCAIYKGAVHGILHTHGPRMLAQKLYLDRNVIIPSIISCPQLRRDMQNGLNGIARLYFVSIPGVEGSTMPSDCIGGWNEVQTMSYELNGRGLSYEEGRKAAVAAANCSGLSPRHWAGKIKLCFAAMLDRHEVFPNGKAFNDINGTWRSPRRAPQGTSPSSHLWRWPYGWQFRASLHLPDFFEYRPMKDLCET